MTNKLQEQFVAFVRRIARIDADSLDGLEAQFEIDQLSDEARRLEDLYMSQL